MLNAITSDAVEASNAKAYADHGVTLGPGSAPGPGEIHPEDFDRPYLTGGHAVDSPGNDVPRQVHMDWRAGVSGEGPIAGRVSLWPAGLQAVAQVPGGNA